MMSVSYLQQSAVRIVLIWGSQREILMSLIKDTQKLFQLET